MKIVTIGFLDSGIGGMTVLHEAMKLLPKNDFLFYADTDHVPYGEKPKEDVREYVFHAVDFMAKQNIRALVIACNTATSITIDDLRETYDFPILGIEPAVKPAVEICEQKQKKVLVLATNLTIREKRFHKLVDTVNGHHIVESLGLPGLVEFAEAFEFRKEIVMPYLKEQLSTFDLKQYGAVVLGCTHFPFFTDSIRELFPNDVHIISGSEGTAMQLKRILRAKGGVGKGIGELTFFNSGRKVVSDEILSRYQKLLTRLERLHI